MHRHNWHGIHAGCVYSDEKRFRKQVYGKMSLINRIFRPKTAYDESAVYLSEPQELFDLHCHLLPYADDGAGDMEEARELIRQEYEQGVRTIVITTHLREQMFSTPVSRIQKHYHALLQWVRQAEDLKELRIYQSREYYCDERFHALLSGYAAGQKEIAYDDMIYFPGEEILPFGSKKCILMEFSTRRNQEEEIQKYTKEALAAGLTPVLAHAERYPAVQTNPDILQQLKKMGVIIQINAEAVLGNEGKLQKELTHRLIETNIADMIASDAHNLQGRRPDLAECRHYLTRKYDGKCAEHLLHDVPYHLIND